MRRMAGLKPMSSMRSTSSSTRISIWLSLTSLRPRKSSRRPGVATISRAPRRMLSSCGPSAMPPTTSAMGRLTSCAHACCTCIASSRVGSRIRAPAVLTWAFCSRSMMGIRKLSVLPVPVCAVANTSRPSSAGGIAPTCTGVGVTKFALASRCLSAAEIGNAENSFKIIPCFRSLAETWSAVHRDTASSVRRYDESPIGAPRSLWTRGPTRRSPSAAAFRLLKLNLTFDDCTTRCAVCRAAEGGYAVAFSQASPVHRTMPGKRVLPTVAANLRGDYAEGLGRYPTVSLALDQR